MPHLTLSNCTVHYQVFNQCRNNETPLILLHANPGNSQDYAAIIPTLAKGYSIITIDWPGYGSKSCFHTPIAALPNISPIIFYDILVEVFTTLNISKAHLIGNSIGGNVAARFAAYHPEKVASLVLVSPGGFTKHNPFTKLFCQYQASRYCLSPYRFAQLYLRKRNTYTKAMLKRAQQEQSSKQALTLSKAMWHSFKTDDNDLRYLAKKITAPTLLIFGKYDPIIPAITDGKQAKKYISQAKKITLSCGHVAFAEVPAAFLLAVTPFLAKHNTYC